MGTLGDVRDDGAGELTPEREAVEAYLAEAARRVEVERRPVAEDLARLVAKALLADEQFVAAIARRIADRVVGMLRGE